MNNFKSNSSHWQPQRHAQGPTSRSSVTQGTSNRAGGPFTAQSNREGNNRTAGRHERPGGAIFLQDQPSTVDARITDGSDKAIVAKLSTRGSSGGTGANGLPLRPDFGMQGRAISLRANFFPVDVRGRIYRYGAAITLPDRKLTRRIKSRVFQLAEKSVDWQQAGMNDHVAHDSAEKLVAAVQLPQPLSIRGVYYDEDSPPTQGGSEYVLTLIYEEEVDQQTLRECLGGMPVDSQALSKVLSALNLILTAHPSHSGIKLGRNDDDKKNPDQRLFFNSPPPKDIGGGLTVREGFYLSVRPAHQQLMVNVNTCHVAFYKPQNFVDAMNKYREFTCKDGGSAAFGKQVRVATRPNNRTVMIKGVSKRNANEQKFKHKEFGFITIKVYYERKYGISLQYPGLPLLESADGNSYPQEVCDILPGQGYKGELTDGKHASNMLDVACKRPKENANEIVNRGMDMLGFRGSNPLLDSFGINVGTEMAVVPGRVLNKPGLSYFSGVPADIDGRASWSLCNVKFAVGAQMDKWAVLVIQDGGRDDFKGANDSELRNITNGFRNMCNKSGMKVQPLKEQAYAAVRLPHQSKDRFRDDAIAAIEGTLKGLLQQVAPELILIMLSSEDKAIYNGIKRVCDVHLDVTTVCMQFSKVKRDKGQLQYYANVSLKVNMKMGGINHTLDAKSSAWLKASSTMVMGMDVTHPAKGPSTEGTPSIVVVVASVDEHFAQYPAALAMRESKVEIERDQTDNVLRDMFVSRFELYQARNKGKLPQRIILYRDGVSESQFVQLRRYELRELQRAFERLGSTAAPYKPKLSIVVCSKRHHTRFYPTKQEDAAQDGNPLPGTVVDRGVTPAYKFDFFLQPHFSLKGTSKPTHYFVVHDENKFKSDELQRVTNDLSYMFVRATKAVSLVSPAYWADVACERGRCYLHQLLQAEVPGKDINKDQDAKGKGKGKRGKERVEESVFEKAERMWGGGVLGPKLRDTMYYL